MRYLPDTAHDAWQAYSAMETTKQRHVTLLAGLEDRYGAIARAPQHEAELLDALLHDHDIQVKRFTAEMRALKTADASAHATLLVYMQQISSVLAQYTQTDTGVA